MFGVYYYYMVPTVTCKDDQEVTVYGRNHKKYSVKTETEGITPKTAAGLLDQLRLIF